MVSSSTLDTTRTPSPWRQCTQMRTSLGAPCLAVTATAKLRRVAVCCGTRRRQRRLQPLFAETLLGAQPIPLVTWPTPRYSGTRHLLTIPMQHLCVCVPSLSFNLWPPGICALLLYQPRAAPSTLHSRICTPIPPLIRSSGHLFRLPSGYICILEHLMASYTRGQPRASKVDMCLTVQYSGGYLVVSRCGILSTSTGGFELERS